MRLVGFNFNKIKAERTNSPREGVEIKNNIDISDISFPKPGFFKAKGDLIDISFNYIVSYSPDIAKIEIGGSFMIEVDSKIFKEVEKKWKDKDLPEDFRMALLNFIVKKANIKALQLEDELSLPYHVPFPTLKKQN